MDFDRSTQSRSWIFDEQSLATCRERAIVVDESDSGTIRRVGEVRSFASGFHRSQVEPVPPMRTTDPFRFEPEDQDALVRFHAHQIQTLVGPTALLIELRTSMTVLSTAVTFFRRFYLSNSVLAVSPRKMAAACAFFAAKVEEQKIEVRHHCLVRCVIMSLFSRDDRVRNCSTKIWKTESPKYSKSRSSGSVLIHMCVPNF
jgi:hypothetical protein